MSLVRLARAIQRHGICCRVAFLLLSGLPIFSPAAAVLAQDALAFQRVVDHRFAAHVTEASQRFRIPESWIAAVLDAESDNVGDVSKAGAMGLMQIMPEAWAELRLRYLLGEDPFDPRDNILAGTAYLREMLDRFGNVGGMLAAYNAGPDRYEEYLGEGRALPIETRNYVAKLAPILGGEPLPARAATTQSPPTDWREAPLFVTPAIAASPAGSLQPGGQSDAEATADPTHNDDATSLPAAGIFVTISAGDSFQ